MSTQAEQIQILYEFSMAIGDDLDLRRMLRKSVSSLLRKLNCPAGTVLFLDQDSEGAHWFREVFSIPRHASQLPDLKSALARIPEGLGNRELASFNASLPLHGQTAPGRFFHISELPGIGIVALLKNDRDLDPLFVKSLGPLFGKLTTACRACMRNEELIHHQNNLQELVSEKTRELVTKNERLTREIEQRQRYEEALFRSEEKYRELVQNANNIILRWDKEGRVTFFNEYGQSFFGFTEEEIIGRYVVGTIVPETESTGRDLAPLMDDICKNPQKYEYSINENLRKDGSRVWVAWANKVLMDESGNPVGALSIGADITDHRMSEQRFKLAAEAISDLIYEWNMVDDSLRWYGDIDKALGFKQGEFPHTMEAWIERIHPEDLARLADAVGYHRIATEPINYEYQIQRKDGSWAYWADYGVPVLDSRNKPCRWVGACSDITEKKQAEQELQNPCRKL